MASVTREKANHNINSLITHVTKYYFVFTQYTWTCACECTTTGVKRKEGTTIFPYTRKRYSSFFNGTKIITDRIYIKEDQYYNGTTKGVLVNYSSATIILHIAIYNLRGCCLLKFRVKVCLVLPCLLVQRTVTKGTQAI